ncbi:hypothetical protein, partial [Streptococcus pluranimalium]
KFFKIVRGGRAIVFVGVSDKKIGFLKPVLLFMLLVVILFVLLTLFIIWDIFLVTMFHVWLGQIGWFSMFTTIRKL